MAQDEQLRSGTANNYKADRGGANLISEAVIGIVKDNVDSSRSGRIRVYIAKFPGSSPDDSNSWTTVRYVSPFAGLAGMSGTQGTGGQVEGYGKFVGNPQSYGFWASAPDIGTEVLCIFAEGKTQEGFYLGCIPKPGLLSMTPAIGSTSAVVPNSAEAKTYGGADKLPTTEVNATNPNLAKSGTIATDPKPIHSYQASILFNQGIIRDNDRGVISSSAQRESPSRVFGFSTPGGPVYSGGYTNSTIAKAATSGNNAKLQITGRTGGHTFVMDDGGLQGEDTLMRLRTSSGHQIMMNDSAQALFIIHANGQSWIELGKEGTIDMFATNSVNIRTEGDLNLHADRDLNLHAAKNLRMYADNIMMEADTNTTMRSGGKFAQQTLGTHTVKATGDLSLASSGAASLAASGSAFINGSKVNLNTGNPGTTPAAVPVMPKTNHPDTGFSVDKGWIYPSPNTLLSVTSRAPTHQPFVGSGKGVDVKVNSVVKASSEVTTPKLNAVNNSVSNTPAKPVTATTVASTPSLKSTQNVVPAVNGTAVTTMAAQQATNNATQKTGTPKPAAVAGATTGNNPTSSRTPAAQYVAPPNTKRGDSILDGPAGLTLDQACGPGMIIKPGSEGILAERLKQGMPYDKAIQGLVTGNLGATNVSEALRNATVQTRVVAASINNATAGLFNAGVLTGSESAGQAGGVVFAAASFGVSTVAAAATGIQNAATGTVNALTGTVTEVAQNVTNTITGALATVNQVAAGIQDLGAKAAKVADAISSGKFAGMVSDGVSSGLSGLANSVTGALKNAIGNIGASISGLAAALTGTLRNAFNQIEASFKNLTAGTANILGESAGKSAVDLTTPAAKFESAKVALDAAQTSYDAASSAYRNNPDDINKAALDGAEQQLSQARQKAASAAGSAITGGIGSVLTGASNAVKNIGTGISTGITNAANTVANAFKPATTKDSGPNALPGGVGAMVNQVSGSGTNAINSVKSSLATVTNDPVGSTLNPAGLVGNLVNNTTNAITSTVNNIVGAAAGVVTGAVGAVTGLVNGAVNAVTGTITAIVNLPAQIVKSIAATVNGIISTVQTTLASIGNMGGQIKAAIAATNTFNKSQMTAKTGQLLEDPKVPTPQSMTTNDKPPATATANVDSSLQRKADKLKEIKELQSKSEELQAQANAVFEQYDAGKITLAQQNAKVEPILKQKNEVNAKKRKAGVEYDNIVADENEPAPDSRLTTGPTSNSFRSSGFANDGNNGLGYNPDGTPWGLKGGK